jgi:hypothetical protein
MIRKVKAACEFYAQSDDALDVERGHLQIRVWGRGLERGGGVGDRASKHVNAGGAKPILVIDGASRHPTTPHEFPSGGRARQLQRPGAAANPLNRARPDAAKLRRN